MVSMRPALVSLLLVVTLGLAAGCGGGENVVQTTGAATDGAAQLAPRDSAAYVGIDTNLDSAQWQQLQELLDRFPDGDQLVQKIVDEAGKDGVSWDDVKPALGPLTAVVLLRGKSSPVVLVQPEDRAKLDALLAKSDERQVSTDLEDGWVAIARTQAELDAYREARELGGLDEDATFRTAMEDLPADSLASGFVRGDAFDAATALQSNPLGVTGLSGAGNDLQSLGFAVEAQDDGLHVVGSVRAKGDVPDVQSYEPTLLAKVPDRTFVALSFHGTADLSDQLSSNGALKSLLPMIEQGLGIKLADVAELIEGEVVLYVRPGVGIPEVTLAAEAPDEARAIGIVDRLARGLQGTVETLEVDGVTAHAVQAQQVRIAWAAFDNVLLVSTGPTAFRDFRGDGEKLVDDEGFQAAMEQVGGLGNETGGLAYVDLSEAVPFIDGLAGLAGDRLPDVWRRNLEPLESFAAQGSQDGDAVRFEAFLGVADR
jgi:hypothetical protein